MGVLDARGPSRDGRFPSRPSRRTRLIIGICLSRSAVIAAPVLVISDDSDLVGLDLVESGGSGKRRNREGAGARFIGVRSIQAISTLECPSGIGDSEASVASVDGNLGRSSGLTNGVIDGVQKQRLAVLGQKT